MVLKISKQLRNIKKKHTGNDPIKIQNSTLKTTEAIRNFDFYNVATQVENFV